jgi:hypothetical protein
LAGIQLHLTTAVVVVAAALVVLDPCRDAMIGTVASVPPPPVPNRPVPRRIHQPRTVPGLREPVGAVEVERQAQKQDRHRR